MYDGTYVRLLEPVNLKPDTPVEVLIPEQSEEAEKEHSFLKRLADEGLLMKTTPVAEERSVWQEEEPFVPILLKGLPLSQTIVEERR